MSAAEAQRIDSDMADDDFELTPHEIAMFDRAEREREEQDEADLIHTDDPDDPNLVELPESARSIENGFLLVESEMMPTDGVHDQDPLYPEEAAAADARYYKLDDFRDVAHNKILAELEKDNAAKILNDMICRGLITVLGAEERSIEPVDIGKFVLVRGKPQRIAKLIQKGLSAEKAEADMMKMQSRFLAREQAKWEAEMAIEAEEKETLLKARADIKRCVDYIMLMERVKKTIEGRDFAAQWNEAANSSLEDRDHYKRPRNSEVPTGNGVDYDGDWERAAAQVVEQEWGFDAQ